MRLVKALLVCGVAVLALAQQPIGIGPDTGAGYAPGLVKYLDWYTGSAINCTAGANGACVGHSPQGDTYYFSAWLPDASGLPVTSGLPVVGTINDWNFGPCGGNIGIVQLDTFSWPAPAASHMTLVNCLTSYGTVPAASDSPAGWKAMLTSGDSSAADGTWKSRHPFSKGGILYLPVERQIAAGNQSIHDGTFIMSPDAGKHWCNPYTYFNHSGSPGCDSSDWRADGDAPKCDAASSSVPCTNAAYIDSTHSSMMWKALPMGTENWLWVNYGYQDGQTPPSGVTDGCDPATYVCFFMIDGSVARVPNASILDVSAWEYSVGSTWTTTFSSRVPVLAATYAGSATNTFAPVLGGVMWLKEFGSYLMAANIESHLGFYQSLRIQGPWLPVFSNPLADHPVNGFVSPAPGLGYTVVSTNPPHIQLATASNSYEGGSGSPHIALWDLVLGQNLKGEAFQAYNLRRIISGAGYQFSDSHAPGTFPRNGLALSFDFLDAGINSGLTNWGYFRDFNSSTVISACEGSYTVPTNCGGMFPAHGTSLNNYGSNQAYSEYNGHFRTFANPITLAPANAPVAMQGNGSFSVVEVVRYEGATPYSRCGSMWATGDPGTTGNKMVLMCQVNGKIELDWNQPGQIHSQYLANFTFPNRSNWYFIATTVQAQTATPTAKVWVGGAITPGVLTDVNAGISWTNVGGTPSPLTPNVAAATLVLGLSGYGQADGSSMTRATTMVYNRALSYPEVQLVYRSMRPKMAARGVTLQ